MDKQQDQPPRKINISEVFKKYQGQLKSFIAKRVTAQEDREDILQDVFYQLLKTDPVAPPVQQISAWLYTVTRNLIIDRKRKHREKEIPQARTEEGETFILKKNTYAHWSGKNLTRPWQNFPTSNELYSS